MRTGRGSRTGSAFEREICVLLSRWWTNDQRDDIFWRSAGSGARATVRGRKGKSTAHQHGDIACTDPIGSPLTDLFAIELKRGYASDSCHDLLDRTNQKVSGMEAWILQAEKSCQLGGTFSWWLITKRNRRKMMIWIPKTLKACLDLMEDESGTVALVELPSVELSCFVRMDDRSRATFIYGMQLETFLLNVRPETIMRLEEVS